MAPSNLEILAYEDTPLGPLCLRRRELLSSPGTVITEVTLNHEFLMSSYHTASEVALADLALDMHPGRALSVLVGGLGLGYTAHAALTSPRVSRVEVVELLPEVIAWLEDDLVPLAATLKADERFVVRQGDVFVRLSETPSDRFDLTLVDVDHAPDSLLSQANSGFYTAHGLERASWHLTPGGVLAVWSSAENPDFVRMLEGTFAEVRAVPVSFFNDLVHEEVTDWIFLGRQDALAGDGEPTSGPL
jgi:spermidine synthase